MFRLTATTLRATTIAIPILLATPFVMPSLPGTSIGSTANAQQFGGEIGYDNFRNQLAPHGTWSNHSRWGEVWQPRADRDFRPYSNGYWANTREYGWLWVSNDEWGDVPYHYGRWVSDPRQGWLWVPGYVWGPSWVVWREGGGNIGWFPMPPDDYYGNGAYGGNFNNQYGYRDWSGPGFGTEQFLALWIFVAMDRFGDRDYRNYILPQRDYGRIVVQTNDTTNYVTINNYVVNRSVDASRLPRDRSQRFQPVPASNVLGRNALATQANVGRQVEQRERQRRPIPATIDRSEQRGRDTPNSTAQQQKPNQQPQRTRTETNANGGAQSSPQADRGPRVITTPPNRDATRQDPTERRNRDAKAPTTQAAPAETRGSQANPQAERGKGSFQAPQAGGARDEKGKVIVQDSGPAPRAQGNAPDAGRQANTEANKTRANRQGDTKNTDEDADEKKKGTERSRN